jgi:hypothetical protein
LEATSATKLFYIYKVANRVVERGELEKLTNELIRLHCVFDKNSLLVNALSSKHELKFPKEFFTSSQIDPHIEASRRVILNIIRLEKLLLYLKNQTLSVSPELKATIDKMLKANACGPVTDSIVFEQVVSAEIFLNSRFSKSNLLVTSDDIEKFKKDNPNFKQNIANHLGEVKKISEATSFILGIFRQIPHEMFWGEDL